MAVFAYVDSTFCIYDRGGNMRKIIILILCWLILIGLGCGENSVSLQTKNAESELRVIVYLKMRNEVVSIMSGYEGPVYTVTTKNGKILGKQLTEQELQVKLPDIYHFLKTSYADDEKCSVIWAGG